MTTCSTCGAQNDPVNRFCDQCGSRIEPSGAMPAAQPAAPEAQPTAAAPTCPNCGAMVLPGQAFCEECGTALAVAVQPIAAPVSVDAPTVFAPPPDAPANGLTCTSCGHQNLPGDRFCDNCGAPLSSAPAAPVIADAPTAAAPGEPWSVPVMAGEPGEPPPATVIEAVAPLAPPPVVVEEPPPVAIEEPPPPVVVDEPASVAVAEPPPVPGVDAQAEYEAKRQVLEGEIARQQQIISQFEQMQAMFGAAAPPAVSQGLAEAHNALAKAQADLNALQPPAPPVDPAVVAALNDEITRQQQIISQFEQMQAMFGAAAPPAVSQGLAEARDALAKAQAELDALGVGGAAAPVAPPPVAPPPVAPPPVAPEPVTANTVTTAAAPPDDLLAASAPTILAPPENNTGPRLIFDDGVHEVHLPLDKAEITVGREDPISGIHPEIDLTPFGGEGGGVSRQHARILHSGDQWSVVDLGSTNYTRVDGVRVEPGAPVALKDGARVQFGRLAVTFKL